MRSSFLCLAFCLVAGSTFLHAQSSVIYNRLRMIVAGKADEVRKELPDLQKENPDDPGVMYLAGVLTDDGAKAVAMYEQVVREHPQSEWADDAQLRIVQYYAMRKDTVRAQRELHFFTRNYPLSEFVILAHDLVKETVGLPATSAQKSVADKAPTPAPTKGAKDKESVLVVSNPDDNKSSLSGGTSDKAKASDSSKKYWGLQVGVYSSKKAADAEAEKYRQQRMKVQVSVKDGKYGVVIGHYSSKESAEKSRDIIQAQCQCSPYIVEQQ